MRLPVGYFEQTKAGALLSRVMNDAEGIRNLVGTGLGELAGGLLTWQLVLKPDQSPDSQPKRSEAYCSALMNCLL